jgi:hypothetical protein
MAGGATGTGVRGVEEPVWAFAPGGVNGGCEGTGAAAITAPR